jgi:hypothetical protein
MTALDYIERERALSAPSTGETSRPKTIAAVLAFAAAVGLAIAFFGLALTPDLFVVIGLAPALVLRRERSYLTDFVPFILLVLAYTELRGVANILRPHPYYLPQLLSERRLFGGNIPTLVIQHWLWSGHPRWYDSAAGAVTRIHFFVPPMLALGFWFKDRRLFQRFAACYLTLSFLAVALFLLFPSAPPWAAARVGLLSPAARLTTEKSLDHLPSHSGPLYHFFLSNPYAAVPSLHAGYAVLVFLFLAFLGWPTRWRWPIAFAAALYPLAQGFAVVYTANHYVVDLLIGALYAGAVFLAIDGRANGGFRRIRRRLLLFGGVATVATAALLTVGVAGRTVPNLGAALARAATPVPGAPAIVDLTGVRDFPWTRFFVFGPGATAETINERLGFHWRDAELELPGSATLILFVDRGTVVRELRYTSSEPRLDCLFGGTFTPRSGRFTTMTRFMSWVPGPVTFVMPRRRNGICPRGPAHPVE